MENQIKVGQTFEVVKILTDGGFSNELFKVGGFTINFEEDDVLANGKDRANLQKDGFNYNQYWAPMYRHEVEPVGRLIITKVK